MKRICLGEGAVNHVFNRILSYTSVIFSFKLQNFLSFSLLPPTSPSPPPFVLSLPFSYSPVLSPLAFSHYNSISTVLFSRLLSFSRLPWFALSLPIFLSVFLSFSLFVSLAFLSLSPFISLTFCFVLSLSLSLLSVLLLSPCSAPTLPSFSLPGFPCLVLSPHLSFSQSVFRSFSFSL